MIDHPITIEIHSKGDRIALAQYGAPHFAVAMKLGEIRSILSAGIKREEAIKVAIFRLESAVEWLKKELPTDQRKEAE